MPASVSATASARVTAASAVSPPVGSAGSRMDWLTSTSTATRLGRTAVVCVRSRGSSATTPRQTITPIRRANSPARSTRGRARASRTYSQIVQSSSAAPTPSSKPQPSGVRGGFHSVAVSDSSPAPEGADAL